MKKINAKSVNDFSDIPFIPDWDTENERELKMHNIHAYPAKFPAFLTKKAIEFAKHKRHHPETIADIFCGCGTVALEARRLGLDFWGCDINPVATMIAQAKSKSYTASKFESYMEKILCSYKKTSVDYDVYSNANERLKYWFKKRQFGDLNHLRIAIEKNVPKKSIYHTLFQCAFSNILKPSSVWLARSIKPQVDPDKIPCDVLTTFRKQCDLIKSAINEDEEKSSSKIKIKTVDCLNKKITLPKVDLIVTSPPYVTSYEYADLHQLSSLWLEYVQDYRELREGSIGSKHHNDNFSKNMEKLNPSAVDMVSQLHSTDVSKSKSVARYFLDMQKVATRCYELLNDNGMVFFVIGNTEYKNVRINNAMHLAISLYEAKFKSVHAGRRKISRKILTPYRTKTGRFTSNKNSRKIYSEEFILVGKK